MTNVMRLYSRDMAYHGVGPRETATFEAAAALSAVTRILKRRMHWALAQALRHREHTALITSSVICHSSHIVQAYAAANVQACGTISQPGAGRPGYTTEP